MNCLQVQRDDFRRAEVLGLSPGGVVDDVRTAAAIRALAASADEAGDVADAAAELADQLAFDGPFLRRRSR